MATLAAVQSNCTVGEVAANLDQTLRLLREAPMRCAQMAVLPERFSPDCPTAGLLSPNHIWKITTAIRCRLYGASRVW